jgi:type IV pilus assembly protein PilV
MIEIMVTVLVLAVGLLGVASMQTVGIRMARDSGLMSQASYMANNMADRMRGNLRSAAAYAGIDGSDRKCRTPDLSADPPIPACTPEQEDIIAWNEDIQSVLPEASGVVDSADSVHRITVSWRESADSVAADALRDYTLVVRL